MTVDERPVIVSAARTPIGTAGRSLSTCAVEDLAAPVMAEVAAAAAGRRIDAAVMGNCMGPGGNVARVSALAARLPLTVAAQTIDQQCASGLGAVAVAASMAAATGAIVVGGGVESASTAPVRLWPSTGEGEAIAYDRAPFTPRGWADPDMGLAADLLAEERGISRARQDEYAARSHERAVASASAGLFDAEIIEVGGVTRDDRPREGFDRERLARFPAAFRDGGTITAANSCGVNDGAAACLMLPGSAHEGTSLPGLRMLAWAMAGVDPSTPGLGLVPAAQQALQSARKDWSDVDVIEFNEAFAGQILACCDELGIDDARVCPQGGAIALGHPWGASGAVLITRLFSQLVLQDAGRIGVAAIAGGGGQGVAVVVERCR